MDALRAGTAFSPRCADHHCRDIRGDQAEGSSQLALR
jgi:hypothetical protein